MKKLFRVKLANTKVHKNNNVEGYLGNSFNNGLISHYTRGEAIKKANAFGGKIEPVKSTFLVQDLKVAMLSEMNLIFPIENLLKGKETAGKANGEVFYYATVFEAILAENTNLSVKVKNQLTELINVMYDYDYFLLVDIDRPKSLM
jgi:hypothetical protein